MHHAKTVLVGIGLVSILFASLPQSGAGGAKDTDKDVVDAAVSAGTFKTLTAALDAAGLTDTLKGKGPFTVFAPTDDAFAKLPKGTVEALLKDKKRLTALLTYHVAPERVGSAEIFKFETATLKSVEGSPIALRVADGSVVLNKSSKVTRADITCRNGVVHVIDAVILPPLFTGEADKALIVGFCESDFTKEISAEVEAAQWDKAAERNKKLLAILKQMGDIQPKLGAKEAWDKQIKYLLNANKVVDERIAKKDALGAQQGANLIRLQCFACHLDHKPK